MIFQLRYFHISKTLKTFQACFNISLFWFHFLFSIYLRGERDVSNLTLFSDLILISFFPFFFFFSFSFFKTVFSSFSSSSSSSRFSSSSLSLSSSCSFFSFSLISVEINSWVLLSLGVIKSEMNFSLHPTWSLNYLNTSQIILDT